ncbi:MAG: polysaccharide biosynthesis/export family protein [Acidobacteriota bacterium]
MRCLVPIRRLPACLAALLAAFCLPALTAAQQVSDYRIGPRDLVDIKVLEVPDLNTEQRVSATGTVSLPIIGEVRVQGYTRRGLAAELERLLEADYVESVTVTVELLEVRSRPISMLGAVAKPGDLEFSGQWTLLEAIAAAGGLAEGHGDSIHVLRRANNGLTDQITIRAQDLLGRADPKVNLPLFAGDLVTVERMVQAKVFFLGEVATPGALEVPSTSRITLLSAIAQVGGLTDRASPRIQIKRRTASGGQQEIEVHYKRILGGQDPDPELRDGDIVYVKESFF